MRQGQITKIAPTERILVESRVCLLVMSKITINQASFGRKENVMEKVVEKSCMEFEGLKRVRTLIQAH